MVRKITHLTPQGKKIPHLEKNILLSVHLYVFSAPPSAIGQRQKKPTNAQIAQLVEQLAFNQLVLGSSPSLRTSLINPPTPRRVFSCPLVTRQSPSRLGREPFRMPLPRGWRNPGSTARSPVHHGSPTNQNFSREILHLSRARAPASAIPVVSTPFNALHVSLPPP